MPSTYDLLYVCKLGFTIFLHDLGFYLSSTPYYCHLHHTQKLTTSTDCQGCSKQWSMEWSVDSQLLATNARVRKQFGNCEHLCYRCPLQTCASKSKLVPQCQSQTKRVCRLLSLMCYLALSVKGGCSGFRLPPLSFGIRAVAQHGR